MHPHQAAPILERYSHVDASGELDYALFLYALVPETSARDATIRQLLGDIVKKVAAKKAWEGEISSLQYDGTDAVTARIVAAASISSVVGGEGAQHVRDPYTIPCAVLAARPALSAALTDGQVQPDMAWARFPLSGCNPTSSSSLKGFPANAVAAFGEAAGKTQGHAVPSQVETQNLYIHGVTADEAMQLNPGFFLGAEREQMLKWPSTIPPQQSFDYPYQVWGYTSLNNYDISMQVRASYRKALAQLTAYYREHMALGTRDSRLAARLALFAAAPGSRCGGAVPETSIRRMLLEHAPRAQIEQQLQQLRNGDIATGEIEECGRFAGVDPVLLVAVGDPAVFPLVLQRQTDVNVSNPIGKTALMEAAQFNQLGVAHLLLAHHAWVNFTTWSDSDPSYDPDLRLGDDARTALMYAAANGSLELIKTLLDAGADAFQADTKGYRAIDYLLGYGPTPPNPHLSKREREQAAQWLF